MDDRSATQISQEAGMDRSNLYLLFKKEKIERRWLNKLSEIGLNVESTNSTPVEKFEAKEVEESDFMKVPVLTTYAQAGYLRGEANADDEKRFEIMLVPREYESGHYLVVEIQGDSMNDNSSSALIEGDKVLVKELDKSFWPKIKRIMKTRTNISHRTC